MLIMLKINEACEIVNDKVEAFDILSTSAHRLTVQSSKNKIPMILKANNMRSSHMKFVMPTNGDLYLLYQNFT